VTQYIIALVLGTVTIVLLIPSPNDAVMWFIGWVLVTGGIYMVGRR